MRVIAGQYRGRRLVTPDGLATRPTADRVKESVFNILGAGVGRQQVLDLFAGSGALGIEAISRGAAGALFLDHGKAALAAIQDNIRNLGLQAQTRVMRWNILKNLKCLMSSPQEFDLIFMDPPYASQAVAPTLMHLLASGALAPGAHLVIEHRAGERIDSRPPFVVVDQRRFGKTLVTFMDAML